MAEESICQGCEGDGFCQIQDNKNEAQYKCPINSKWASAQSRLEAVKTYISKLRDQAKKTHDIFERGFCTGIADRLEKILEAEG